MYSMSEGRNGNSHVTSFKISSYRGDKNSWRPHMTLDGTGPDDVYYDRKPEKPKRNAKTVPCNIEQRLFRQTRITGYRLPKVA